MNCVLASSKCFVLSFSECFVLALSKYFVLAFSECFVSRQTYFYTEQLVVEVAAGGIDHAGPDMLTEAYKHLGEGEAFEDPRKAVEAAIAICKQWRQDDGRQDIHVAVGDTPLSAGCFATGGMGIELEPATFAKARKWARQSWEQMPKCDQCGELLPGDGPFYTLDGDEERGKFCSGACADKAYLSYLDEVEE